MIKEINNGVYPTMLTPFTDDNKVDYNGVLQLLDFYKTNGVSGIFAVCQSSEIFNLSFEERLELLEFIMKNKPEGISIVASGHTADDIDTQIKEAQVFTATGIDAYVFIANRFAGENEDEDVFMRNYEKAVAALPDTGFGIYECPYPYKRLMTPSLIKKCCETSPLKFIKDTCGNISQIRAKLEAAENTGLKIFNANGATLLESLEAGCAGYSGVMANFHPDLFAWLCENYKKEPEKAKQMADFLSFASTVESRQYPVNAKYHLSLLGVDIGTKSRVCDDSGFVETHKKEMAAMAETENLIRKLIIG